MVQERAVKERTRKLEIHQMALSNAMSSLRSLGTKLASAKDDAEIRSTVADIVHSMEFADDVQGRLDKLPTT